MMEDVDNGAASDVHSMATARKAQVLENELRMELRRTGINQKKDLPPLTSGAFEESVEEERVAQWMRLCVGALKEFLDKAGGPLQRPLDHARASDLGVPPPP